MKIAKSISKLTKRSKKVMGNLKIAVAGSRYAGLSIATLLSQLSKVIVADIIPKKVDLINFLIFLIT